MSIAPPPPRFQRRALVSIVAVAVIFVASVLSALKFGGSLSGTYIGIIASIMTPAIGALITIVVVQPLRASTGALRSEVKEVKVLVNGQFDAMRAELARAREIAADQAHYINDLISQNNELQATVKRLTGIDNRSEDDKKK